MASHDFARWLKEDCPAFLELEEPFELDGLHGCIYRRTDPKGVAVVVHGFTGSARKLTEVSWHFWNMGCTVVAYDQRGHGYSQRETGDPSLVHIQDFEEYVKDLGRLLNRIREHTALPVVLYGHSMGGGVCAVAAARSHIHKLILSSPMIRPDTRGIPFPAAMRIADRIGRRNKEAYVPGSHPYRTETFEKSAGTSLPRFLWYQKIREGDIHYQTAAPSVGWLRESGRVEELLESVHPASYPDCLVLECAHDTFVQNRHTDRFARRIGAKKLVFDHVKHELYNSPDPVQDRYWQAIRTFLDL